MKSFEVRNDIFTSPELFSLADRLQMEPDHVVGKLLKLALWFRDQLIPAMIRLECKSDDLLRVMAKQRKTFGTTDPKTWSKYLAVGRQMGAMCSTGVLDRIAGVQGFCAALKEVKWMEIVKNAGGHDEVTSFCVNYWEASDTSNGYGFVSNDDHDRPNGLADN